MEHTYDWTFWEVNSNHNARGPLYVSTSMMKKPKSQSTDTTATTTSSSDNGLCYFNANLKINNIGLRPHRLAWQVISYPIFCMIIQLWIHYEAFWLFVKGVTYVPHPEESETAASRIIGNMMIPFFMLRDLVDSATKSSAKIKE
mmetsp:Transcript_594/g.841  ORF Transcript_594/g.841 Transcript_594/m.841 type:complete len:144 (+) Transcript_594:1-432(+)